MERAKKAVVIGAEGYSMATDEVAVSCYSWKNIKKIKNICDYDYVLVNLLSISDENSRNDVDWKQVNTVLCLKNTLEVLRHKGLIVIVGDPRFSTSITSETKSIQKPFLDWTGMLFIWDNSPGDTIDSLSHQFRFYQDYVDRLKKWSYSLSDVLANDEKRDEILRVIGRSGDALSIKASKRSICQNRYRKDLIFQAGLCVTQREQYPKTNQSKLLVNFGDIVFLPPIDASKEETLLITMYRMFGIEASSPEPQWGDSCKVPNQELYLGKIGDVELEIQVLNQKLKQIQEELRQARKHVELLYARELALESVVREVFRHLGASVEEPQGENKEDGWIAIKIEETTYEGVLEIKSTHLSHFKENGIRQLLEWIQRGISFRQKKYKGVFVGNSSIDQTPKERVPPFSDSWKTSAKLNEICALTSVDLYVIYTLFLLGNLDTDAFWRKLFTTDGIFDAQSYWDQLSDLDLYLV